MKYLKIAGSTTCSCAKPKSYRADKCRECAKLTTKTHKTLNSDKTTKYEFEEIHLWEKSEFQSYVELIKEAFELGYQFALKEFYKTDYDEAAFRKLGFMNVRELHELIGEDKVIRKWTFDAFDFLNVERDESKLVSVYRLKGEK